MNCDEYGYSVLVEAEDIGWNPSSDVYYRCDLG